MGANALFVLPTSGEIRFSKVRDMYDQDAGGLSLSNYYRSTTTSGIVNSDTYHSTVNPFVNTAHSIPESGELKMSQFRGAFKEHRVPVGNVTAPYNINPSTTEHRTYRYYVTGVVSSSTWDSSGNGISGMVVNVAVDNIRIIVHVTADGKIGAGPGQGGAGGAGGNGGTGATGGTGSSQNGVAGGNADCNVSTNGADGYNGSAGKRGGHCIEIVDYTLDQPFHILCNSGKLIPGGGGGGGAGGGGGGGAGEAGGGGGKGAQGYNLITSSPSYGIGNRIRQDRLSNGKYDYTVRFADATVYDTTDYTQDGESFRSSFTVNGVTYTKGAMYSDDGDGLRNFYVIATNVKSYFDGGNGGNGRSGETGVLGWTGAAGGRGGYLQSDGNITSPSTGHALQGDRSDTSGTAGVDPYGQPSINYYNGTCNAGFGGRGGGSGGGGGGGGYASGGAGGAAAIGTSSAGNVGGRGRNGRNGLSATSDSLSGHDNGCGGIASSYGGGSCQKTSGGDGAGGGGGGAAGSTFIKAGGIIVSSNC